MSRLAKLVLAAAGLTPLSAAPGAAHFLSIYTPQPELAVGATVPINLMFWHPLFTGTVLNLAKPEEFFVTHRGERTELLDRLNPITFIGRSNAGAAFRVELPLTTAGDYVLTVVPQPYFAEAEGIYIQQITKAHFNAAQAETDWNRPIGLPAEIYPISRPYNVFVG